jgi:CP family cyanate transporter-like MFS transporter
VNHGKAITISRRPPATFGSPPSSPFRGRILVLIALACAAANLRIAVTALSPLVTWIGADLHFGVAVVGVFGALAPAFFAVFGIITPRIMRVIGAEATAVASMGLMAVGEAARAFASSTEALLLLTAVALIGTALANVCIPPLIKKYFPDRIGALSTIQLVALHAGALIPPLVAVPLAEAAGWRAAIGLWAGVAAAAAVLWITVLVLGGRRQQWPVAYGASSEPGLQRPVWRIPRAWYLALLYGMGSWHAFIFFTWLPTLLIDAGAAPALGGAMVSLIIGVSMVFSLILPTLALRMHSTFPLIVVSSAALVVGYAGLATAPAVAPVLWTLLLGIGGTVFPMSLMMINTNARTATGAAALSGFVQGIGCTVALFGPLLFGIVHAQTGTWAASYILVAGSSILVILAAGWKVRHNQAIEDTATPAQARRSVNAT